MELVRESEYEAIRTNRLSPMLASIISASENPTTAYVDLRDNMNLDEAADIIEVLLVRAENDRRAHDAADARAKRSRNGR